MAEVKITGVHPLADLFPMMSDSELQVLAADIKANGQQEKGKVTPDGLLAEGRNRRAACKIAGIEFEYEVANGNVGDMIVSGNIMRRHLTKGQIAMLAVLAETGAVLPDSVSETQAGGGLGDRMDYDYQAQAHRRVESLVSAQVIKVASNIIRWAPDHARTILESGHGWKEAQEIAVERARDANSEARRREVLATEEPDLLAQVDEKGGITLDEAWRLRESRIRQERETQTRLTGYLVERVQPLLGKSDPTDLVTNYNSDFAARKIGVAEIDQAIEYLKAIRAEFKRQKKGEE